MPHTAETAVQPIGCSWSASYRILGAEMKNFHTFSASM
jgi:hypothetical protein